MHRAGDKPVGVAELNHHHAVVHRVGHELRRLLLGEALRLAQLEELRGVRGRLVEAEVPPEQHRLGQPFATRDGGGLYGAGLVAFRQHDSLDACARLFPDSLDEAHRYSHSMVAGGLDEMS